MNTIAIKYDNIGLYGEVKSVIDELTHQSKPFQVINEQRVESEDSASHTYLSKKFYVYISDENEKIFQEELLKILGRGGSKTAFELKDGRALLLPYMKGDSLEVVRCNWERMAIQEVKMSQ